MKLIDITGKRFGRLVVLRKGPPRGNGGSNWACLCDCGTEFVSIGSNIRKGHTTSCGCVAREWAKSLGANKKYIELRAERQATHGHKRRGHMSPEYKVWLGMKRRCYDTKYKDYANWGGRGIKVCAEWRDSFVSFLRDMGPRPEGHSIDRLDSNKDYMPGNCRWATLEQQGGENKRTNRPVAVGDLQFQSVAAACRHFGVSVSVANTRITAGIPMDVAVSTTERMKPRRTRESYWPKAKRPAA